MDTQKTIGADGFINEIGEVKAVSPANAAKEAEKTANQLYNEFKSDEKKKGNDKPTPFKDWLKKAQADGTLKNIQEQGMSLIGDIVEITKKHKDGSKSSDVTDDILSKIDKADLDIKDKKPTPSPAFLGVPMPVWYVGIGIAVVVGGIYIIRGASGSNDAPEK